MAEHPRDLAWARAGLWLVVASLIVFLPEAMTRWYLPKDAVAAFAVVAASLALGAGRLPRWFVGALAAVAALLLVGVAFSDTPWAAFWGRWPRYEGAVTLPVYIGAAWLGARLLGPGASAGRRMTWHTAVATASVLLGVVGVLEALGLQPIPTNLDRPGALLGSATDQGAVGAAFALVLAPVAVRVVVARVAATPARGSRPRGSGWLLPVAGAAGGVVSVVLSASRGALLGFAAGAVVLIVLEVLRLRRAAPAPVSCGVARMLAMLGASVGGLLVVVAAALALPATRERLLGTDAFSAQSVSDRVAIWRDAIILLAQRPLTGLGPNSFVDAVPAVHDVAWFEVVGSQTVLDSPHNVVLQAALGGGVLLALAVVALGVAVLAVGARAWWRTLPARGAADDRRGDPARDRAGAHTTVLAGALAALTALAVALLTSFTVPATGILGAVLAGVLVAAPTRSAADGLTQPAGTPSAPRRRVPALVRTSLLALWALALWALALTITAVAEIPLQQGVVAAASGDGAAAQSAFDVAATLRPWDADVASIAAQSLANAALQTGVDPALAAAWAERSLTLTPDSIPSLRALAAAQDAQGDLTAELATLDRIVELSPADPDARALRDTISAKLVAQR